MMDRKCASLLPCNYTHQFDSSVPNRLATSARNCTSLSTCFGGTYSTSHTIPSLALLFSGIA